MDELMIKIDNVSKQYKLGQIGGTTLRDELHRKRAKLRGKEDPTKKIGAKDYTAGETFMALDGISFDVKKGERVGIIGHNGAGKSTLLKLLSRVTAPSKGMIGLNGRITSMLEVGTGFHGELTGRENIYMNGAILGMTRKEIDSKIEEIIDFSEVRQFIDTPVKRYSSGMYVKLAFSVAAHLDSEIMIMDEVLAVGDMAFQKKCLDKMKSVSEEDNRTILYVSHNMNTIRQLCDRVVVLDRGKVVFGGDVEEGISIYLNQAVTETGPDYDCSLKRHYVNEPGYLTIDKIHLADRQDAIYLEGEPLRLFLDIKVLNPVMGARFRISLLDKENKGLATSFSEELDITECKEQTVALSLDMSNLRKNKYYASIAINTIDENGNNISLDHVTAAFKFEIIPNIQTKEMNWYTPGWGCCRLADLKVELEKS